MLNHVGPCWAYVEACWAMLAHVGPMLRHVGPCWAYVEPTKTPRAPYVRADFLQNLSKLQTGSQEKKMFQTTSIFQVEEYSKLCKSDQFQIEASLDEVCRRKFRSQTSNNMER